MSLDQSLTPYVKRVRLLRLGKFVAFGLLGASAILVVWGVSAAFGRATISWPVAAGVLGGFGFVGALIGWLLPLPREAVAKSVDRRADLKDRLTSGLEIHDTPLSGEIQSDAESALGDLTPTKVYPFRWTGIQSAASCAFLLALGAVPFGQSMPFVTKERRAEQSELRAASPEVERIAKELEVGKAKDQAAEKKLAAELRKFAQELNRADLNKEQALQKAQSMAEQAKQLTETRLEKAEEKMESLKTESVREQFQEAGGDMGKLADLKLDSMQMQMLEDAMKQSGADQMLGENIDEETMKALGADNTASEMARMSQQQRESVAQEIAKQQQQMQQKMSDPNLSQEERQELQKQMEAMQDLAQKLQMSEEVQKALQELQNSEEFQKMQEMMQQMQQNMEQMQQGEPMTPEQMEQLQKAMEEFAEAIKDPERREQMRQQMQEMLDQMQQGNLSAETMQQMMSLLGQMNDPSAKGGRNDGGQFMGEGENEKGDPMELAGKTSPTAVRGRRDEKRGDEVYTEIKAPTTTGNRTSVPYNKVLPRYQKTAESAIGNNKIPPKHRQRVREYFDSLGQGK
ncbi:MAG: hypothetical protein LCH41_14435 [Armatimonadetes bacterium]|nr:hypothetical protein [Armatimonadota bacterium]